MAAKLLQASSQTVTSEKNVLMSLSYFAVWNIGTTDWVRQMS